MIFRLLHVGYYLGHYLGRPAGYILFIIFSCVDMDYLLVFTLLKQIFSYFCVIYKHDIPIRVLVFSIV